ncbi:MAG: hypothetical protein LBR77_09925 [Lachnospiraceae bacterium]|jgi:xylulokinase|nr:hypothetical protein [Lachnospiraceae bacterium]
MKYIIAHDFGTSSLKSAIFSEDGELRFSVGSDYPTYRPRDGWVEQDAQDWWNAFCDHNKKLTAGIDPKDVVCVSFDGTTADSVCIGADGEPLYRAMIWQDRRAQEEGQEVKAALTEQTGAGRGFMGPGRSGIMLYWIKKNEPAVFAQTKTWVVNNAAYVIYKLTGKSVCDRQVGWASAFADADKKDWTYDLVDKLGIPRSLLPELHDSTDIIGEVTEEVGKASGLAAGTKIVVGTGDGESVDLGAGFIYDGAVAMTCGTSGGMSVFGNPKNLPGTSATGASMEWLRKTICTEEEREAKETGKDVFEVIIGKAQKAPVGSHGVVYHPYLAGERGVRMNMKARASFTGISSQANREDIIRSVIEGIGFSLNGHVVRYRADGYPVKRITATGGMTKSPFVMQVFADIMDAEIVTVKNSAWCGCTGGAILGSIAVGFSKDLKDAAAKFVHVDTVTAPNPENQKVYAQMLPLFEEIYEAQKPLYEKMS